MPLKTNAEKIVEFHDKIEAPLPSSPILPSLKWIELSQNLIDEEYRKVTVAFQSLMTIQKSGNTPDISPLMHELVDLLYVAYHAMWTFGIHPDPIFAEVHRANLSKAGGPRRADGKLLKPPGWQPANVANIIDQMREAAIFKDSPPRYKKTNAEKIVEFHNKIGSPLPSSPMLPTPESVTLRQKLIDEEYKEVSDAFRSLIVNQQAGLESNVSPLMHELADLLYVTYGAIWAFGIHPDPVFAEVYRAKLGKVDGLRRADGKTLKPPGWKPADVSSVIEQMRYENA